MILVALGANLPDGENNSPLTTCLRAVEALGSLPGYSVVAVSRWYETAPVPPSGQPPYVNGVVRMAGPAEPENLLAALQAIERAAGRQRGLPNAARTLDLDIVAMDGLVRRWPDPIIPHPRAHERAFVLVPLADVAPDWVHPVLGRTAKELQKDVQDQSVRPLLPAA